MTTEMIYPDDEIVDAELVDPLEVSDSTAVAVPMSEAKRAYIAGLREMADFMEEHPDLAPEYSSYIAYIFASTKRKMAMLGLQLGNAEKSANDSWFNVTRKFGPHSLQVTIARDLACEKKVVGTITEEVEVPDPEAVAKLPTVKRTTVTEKVEWICPPSLHDLLREDA